MRKRVPHEIHALSPTQRNIEKRPALRVCTRTSPAEAHFEKTRAAWANMLSPVESMIEKTLQYV